MKKFILFVLAILVVGVTYAGVDVRWPSIVNNALSVLWNIYMWTGFNIYDAYWNAYSTWAGGWGGGSGSVTSESYIPYASGSIFRSSSLFRQSDTVIASTGSIDVRSPSTDTQNFAIYWFGDGYGNGIRAHSADRMWIYATINDGAYAAVYAEAGGRSTAIYGKSLWTWLGLHAISESGTGAFLKGSGTALYTEWNIVNSNNYVSPGMIGLGDITDPTAFVDIQGSKPWNAVLNSVNNWTNGKWVLARVKLAWVMWVTNGTGGAGGYFGTVNASGVGLYAEKYYSDPTGTAARFLGNLVMTWDIIATGTGRFSNLCLWASCIAARPSAGSSIFTTIGNFSYYTGNIAIGTNTGTQALTVSGNILVNTGGFVMLDWERRIWISGWNLSFQAYTGGNRVEKWYFTK